MIVLVLTFLFIYTHSHSQHICSHMLTYIFTQTFLLLLGLINKHIHTLLFIHLFIFELKLTLKIYSYTHILDILIRIHNQTHTLIQSYIHTPSHLESHVHPLIPILTLLLRLTQFYFFIFILLPKHTFRLIHLFIHWHKTHTYLHTGT